MDLETKCPHCDQWTESNVESCSKCGGLLFESKEGANPLISSLKKNWKLATGLAVAVLILSVLFQSPTYQGDRGGSSGRSAHGKGGSSSKIKISIAPGALVLNDDLAKYLEVFGKEAESLQDLVDAEFYDSMEELQSTAPPGAEWGIDPDTGAVVPIYP